MKIKYTNRFLSFLLFVIPLFFTPNAFAGISDGLVAYYPFNGAANDASGNGNNGTVAGATLTEDRFGNASSAYSFDGNDDKITVSDAPALNFGTGSFTLAVWIQNNQSGIWKRILTKRGSASYWYSLSIYSGKARLEISAGVSLDSTVAINDNAWHFLLVKRDTTAGVFSLYVDGELPSTMSDAGQNLNSGSGIPLEIAMYDSEPKYDGAFFTGKIDDIRIYNRALSEAEVQALYNESAATTTSAPAATTTAAATTTTSVSAATTTTPAQTTSTTTAPAVNTTTTAPAETTTVPGATTSIPSNNSTTTTAETVTTTMLPDNAATYTLSLSKGWNLISLPVQPLDTSIEQVTASIQGQFKSIWTLEGQKLVSYLQGKANSSKLKTMEAGHGYLINMTQDSATLLVTGMPPSPDIKLFAGWNWAGYNSPFALSPDYALNSLGTSVVQVIALVGGKLQTYTPGKGAAPAGDLEQLLPHEMLAELKIDAAAAGTGDLATMKPGAGYLINVRKDASWSFDRGTTVSPDSGGSVSADGASVSLPPGCASGPVSISLKKLSDASGELDHGYIKAVSGEYQLMVSGAADLQRNITFSVPVSAGLLTEPPEGFQIQSFLNFETYNDNTGTWARRGSQLVYDEASGLVSVSLAAGDLVFSSTSLSTMDINPVESEFSTRQWRVICLSADNGNIVQKKGSPFYFLYWPAAAKLPDSVMVVPSNTPGVTDPEIDDYIEYLDYLLQAAYKELLLNSKNTAGQKVFDPLAVPQMVTVRDLGGGAEGKTPIGGPMILHSSQGINYLPNIVAHELVHVFQNQYYSKYFVGYLATWFIEGTADFYSELVFNPYNKSVDDHYLSVPIDAGDDNSYYNVKYFLKWLSETYGDNIVGDTLSQRRSEEGSLYDENNLSVAINELSTAEDINTAFEKYCWYVMQNPDKMVNSEIKTKMEGYISKSSSGNPSYDHLSNPSTTFDDKKTFFTLSEYMNPLSAVYFVMRSKSTEDAKLVIAPADVSGKGIIGTMSYVGVGKTSADYQGKHTVEQDNGLSADVPRLNMLTVKNFKKGSAVEHMLYHPDRLAQALILIMDYYILQVPKVTWVQPASAGTGTRITWQAVGNIGRRGGIPADYIKGYDIFDAAGNKLNAGKIPVTVGAASQYYEISSLNPAGKTVKDFTVVIEDKYGNKWPEITPSNNSSDKFKKLYVRVGAEFSSTGPNADCKAQTLVPNPMTFESLIWLGNNNFTGTMLYEGTTGKWPVGTVTGQISNDKPPKLNLDISLSFPETKIKLIDIPNIGVENEYNCSDDAAKHSLVSFYELLFGCEFTQDTVKTVNLIQATFQDPY